MAREDRLETLAPLGQHRCEVCHRGSGGQPLDAGKLGREAAVDEDQTGAAEPGAEPVDRHRCVLVTEPGRRPLEGHREDRLEARVAPVLVLAGREAVRADPVRRGPPRPGQPRGTVVAGVGLEQGEARRRRNGDTRRTVATGGHGTAHRRRRLERYLVETDVAVLLERTRQLLVA